MNRIAVKTTGTRVGKSTKEERIVRVQVDDGDWRAPKNDNLTRAILWIMDNGFELEKVVRPRQTYGTIETVYIYTKPDLTKN